MKILIIGSGAREHAIAETLHNSIHKPYIIVSPGNAGIAKEFETIELSSFEDIEDYCVIEGIEFVFIGPEKPLADGLADHLRKAGIKVVGPSQAAARIESSKSFAKNLMQKWDIPTAKFKVYDTLDSAVNDLTNWQYPIVIKADGLASGKGVFIEHNRDDATKTLINLMQVKTLNDAGAKVIIEEFLVGWEVSLFAITDGNDFVTTIFSQDHKQLKDNDLGPNTGGMGAYAPVPEAEEFKQEIETTIIAKTINALKAEKCPFSGILYIGLMITKEGPKVVEFNSRLGDPETQAILPLLESDFVDICKAVINESVASLDLKWSNKSAVCVYAVTEEYPLKSSEHYPIVYRDHIISHVFYGAVTELDRALVTNGGRVLSITAVGMSKDEARIKVYRDLQNVFFDGIHFRTDIGLRNNIQ